ncbi:MAG: patatin-like phospholipase family protein [Curvibacter sp.]
MEEGTAPNGNGLQGGLDRLRHWLGGGPARVNLALQGGGAHGAYTWGVLDALLEVEGLNFEGLSGSSAGAMNAVLLADGWIRGGRSGAREALSRFWNELGQHMPSGLVRGKGSSVSLAPAGKLLATWAGQFSPAQLNPLDLNPLRDLLQEQLDFEALRTRSPFKLFIGTTQVNTAKLRIFREHELSVDVLLASACLPRIHRTVMIEGEPYWDGGYSANPAVFPLFYDCDARDVLLVLLNPLRRATTPNTLAEIETRISELGFNSHFMREMRMFAQATEFSAPTLGGRLENRLREMRFHMIGGSELESLARSDSKLLPHTPFLQRLMAQGREHAQAWLRASAPELGRRSTIDVQALFG